MRYNGDWHPYTLLMKMNTKLLMSSSAVSLGIIGLSLTFLAPEIAGYILVPSTTIVQLFIQLLGALYFAFAMLNWMAKGNVMGGIYNRPIAIANLTHFMVGGLALFKSLLNHPDLPYAIWAVAVLYIVFALLFGIVFFQSPASTKKSVVVN